MLLFSLIQALDNTETGRLKQMDLSRPEITLLNYCVSVKNKKSFPSNTAIKQLGFSKTYLHKLSSQLLNKTLQTLYGDDFNKQVSALATKIKLVAVTRHLMKIREKQLLQQNNRDELKLFYRKCFDVEAGQYASDFNQKLLTYYYSRYLQYEEAKLRSYAQLELQLKMHDTAANHYGSKGNMERPKTFKQYDDRFAELLNKTVQKKYYNLQVTALMYRCNLYLMVQSGSNGVLPLLDHALKVARAHPNAMPPETIPLIMARQAKAFYFTGRYADAYNTYCQMDAQNYFVIKGVSGADVSKFIQVSLVTGHYQKANEMLQRFFSKFYGANNSGDVMAQLQQIKYLVYTGAYAEALLKSRQVIKMAQSLKLVQYHVEAGILLSVCLFFTGNKHDAYLIADRNLKQLYPKNRSGEMTDFIEAFRLLKALCKGGGLVLSQRKIMDKFQTDSFIQYGILFKRMQRE